MEEAAQAWKELHEDAAELFALFALVGGHGFERSKHLSISPQPDRAVNAPSLCANSSNTAAPVPRLPSDRAPSLAMVATRSPVHRGSRHERTRDALFTSPGDHGRRRPAGAAGAAGAALRPGRELLGPPGARPDQQRPG